MPVELEGGCRVVDLKEGAPVENGATRIWQHFQGRLSMRVIELGGDAQFGHDEQDEVLYDLQENVGVYIPAG
jgi:hypothetical protein